MHSLKERLHREIEQLGEAELRALQRFIADLTLPEAEPLPAEVVILADAETLPGYVPWQRRTRSS